VGFHGRNVIPCQFKYRRNSKFRFLEKLHFKMSNLDVLVSSFWQLARHCKSGGKAMLELACEDGNLHLQLSAMLGHPDHAHFPTPPRHPPPSSCKRKSPSQLRSKKHHQQEGIHRAEKGAPDKEQRSVTHVEKI
jgi:hypothetical protein